MAGERKTTVATELVRQSRKAHTASERLLWYALRDRKLNDRKFRRQHPIGGFIVDFYCPEERLIVEVDGGIHRGQRGQDRARQQRLEATGLRVLRVTSEQVEKDIEAVLRTIAHRFLTDATSEPLSLQGRGVADGQGEGRPAAKEL